MWAIHSCQHKRVVYDVISSDKKKSKFGPAVIVSKLNISHNTILLIN